MDNKVKLLVGVMQAEFGRHATFEACYDQLILPPMSFRRRAIGQSPAINFNDLIHSALGMNSEYVLILDDDHMFAPDSLMKLLRHMEAAQTMEAITGLYLMRRPPFQPVIFDPDYVSPTGKHHWRFLRDGERGVVETSAVGTGFLLMRTQMFKTIPPPWSTLGGENNPAGWCNDINFSNYMRKFGVKFYCDLETPIGHATTGFIAPTRLPDGKWGTTIAFPNEAEGCQIVIEAAKDTLINA